MREQYSISVRRNHLEISGSALQKVHLNYEGYFQNFFSLPSEKIQELVLIAAGIYAVDRISKKPSEMSSPGRIRQLHIIFRLKFSDFWSNKKVAELLIEIASLLTDDDWEFTFTGLAQEEKQPRLQDYLDFSRESFDKVALYSGGLDSAAGLVHRLISNLDQSYLLITVGHYYGLHHRVQKQLIELSKLVDLKKNEGTRVAHSTLNTHLRGGKSVRMRDQEISQRSRAFFFCATAASAADVFKTKTVEIFENGIGSINLPVMTGMLGCGHATRGAHPSFLSKISTLCSIVLERDLEFILPFSDLTKGEMLSSIKLVPGIESWLQNSLSCIHTSLRVAGISHCGECPACIERIQAFVVAGFSPKIEKFEMNPNGYLPKKLNNREYFNLYRLDALKWQENSDDVHRRLQYHLAITGMKVDELERLTELHIRHSREITHVFNSPFYGG